MRKKFQRLKILKIENFKDQKFQNLKISISKKKVARSDFREFQLHSPPGQTIIKMRQISVSNLKFEGGGGVYLSHT